MSLWRCGGERERGGRREGEQRERGRWARGAEWEGRGVCDGVNGRKGSREEPFM